MVPYSSRLADVDAFAMGQGYRRQRGVENEATGVLTAKKKDLGTKESRYRCT